jgi:hypothetical protein
MGSQRFEVESEAWHRAVAEGRIVAVSDKNGGLVWRERAEPDGYRTVAERRVSPARFASARD